MTSAPYPTIPVDPTETVDGDYGVEDLECVCGNTGSEDGFAQGDAAGRLADLSGTTTPAAGLASGDLETTVCHSCGRVYRDADFDAGESRVHPSARFDVFSPEFQAAQRAYWVVNGFLTEAEAAGLTTRTRPTAQ